MRRMVTIACAMAFMAVGAPSAVVAEGQPPQPFGELPAVPDELLGTWKMVGEKCEEGETPSTRQVDALIRFESDFKYELTVEGWRSVGRYRVERMRDSPLTIRLDDTLYEFDFVDGHLENWSEGDAVYLCGRIFERTSE